MLDLQRHTQIQDLGTGWNCRNDPFCVRGAVKLVAMEPTKLCIILSFQVVLVTCTSHPGFHQCRNGAVADFFCYASDKIRLIWLAGFNCLRGNIVKASALERRLRVSFAWRF